VTLVSFGQLRAMNEPVLLRVYKRVLIFQYDVENYSIEIKETL